MTTKMNGKKVLRFYIEQNVLGNPYSSMVGMKVYNENRSMGVRERVVEDIYVEATYHGDRDEFWIVEKFSDGVERRHNMKYVKSFDLKGDV